MTELAQLVTARAKERGYLPSEADAERIAQDVTAECQRRGGIRHSEVYLADFSRLMDRATDGVMASPARKRWRRFWSNVARRFFGGFS